VHVRWLELVGFRNHAASSIEPSPGLNVVVGANAQGKTAVLEAVAVLLAGRSFRTARLGECVGWDAAGRATLAGAVASESATREVRLELLDREGRAELRGDLCPWARAVAFSATDLALITGAPQLRRAYLDGVTSKLLPAHAESCRRYRIALLQRQRLLGSVAGRADAERLLGPWDEQVAGLGSEIVHRRLDVLASLGGEVAATHAELAPEAPPIALIYTPAVMPRATVPETRAALHAALVRRRGEEVRRGVTLVGPHRDDVTIRMGRAEARTAASRGEQRRLALALRLAEVRALRRRLGSPPVFLLDDLLAELDAGARRRIVAALPAQGQVLFSTTDAGDETRGAGAVWEVEQGVVRRAGALARGAM
jgi:DNA replication and repair protein RecF